MRLFKKLLSLLVVLTFTLTTFGSITAQASEVNRALASDPVATLNAIDSMNLQTLPDGVAKNVRGEFLPLAVILDILWVYGVNITVALLPFLTNYTLNTAGKPTVGSVLIQNRRPIVYTISGWVPLENSTTPMMLYR